MDAQGGDRARPYVDGAGATFTTVVDQDNHLGQLYGFKAIPNGFLIDERGVVRYKKLGGFDIRRPETAGVLEQWTAGPDLAGDEAAAELPLGREHLESNALFRDGMALYRLGRLEEAVALWRQGLAIDPRNYIIRKQIWAVENPERFYDGDIDSTWQKQQIAKGR